MASTDPITVSPITDPSDFSAAYDITAAAFGRQTNDAVWQALKPDWDQPLARANLIARDIKGFEASLLPTAKSPRTGLPNRVYLKATYTDPATGVSTIAGVAIWSQLSFVEGWGEPPNPELPGADDGLLVAELQPDEATAQRKIALAKQVFASLMTLRTELIREIAETKKETTPAVFALDLCAVHPDFQKRGLASRLVQWGIDDARENREGIEPVLEASVMGRSVYKRLGFQGVAEAVYLVDEDVLEGKVLPSNLFMRMGS